VTFFKRTFYCSALLITLSALNSLAIASDSIPKDIKTQILTDLTKIHPTANINIAFNLPNTQKKISKCRNFSLPPIKKISAGGRFSLRLSCKHPKWTTYITFKASIKYPVATAKAPITKGQKLTNNNIRFTMSDVTKIHRGYYISPEPLFGKVAKRVIKQLDIISPHMLDSPQLISKDDTVMITSHSSIMSVSTLGTALQNGKKGRQIRVRNNRSGKVIKAYVTAVGKVSTTP
jgi:flagella basal body P-ring formation protein FlgA